MKGSPVLIVLLLLIACPVVGQLQPVYRIGEKDLIPEGIAYDPASESFFVGSINKRKVVRIAKDGKVSDFVPSRHYGLGEVLGMKVDENRKLLVAVSNDGEANPNGRAMIHIFRSDGSLLKKFELPANGEIRLFNDLILGPDGDIFITDSDGASVFRVNNNFDSLHLWLKSDQLRYANGITLAPDQKNLIVSTGRGFVKVDLSSKAVVALPFGDYYVVGIDGLYTHGSTLVGIQNVTFPVAIAHYQFNSDQSIIEKAKLLAVDDPLFDLPTTGAIVGDWFYFIANSQLRNYKEGKILQPEKLKEIVIARVKLK